MRISALSLAFLTVFATQAIAAPVSDIERVIAEHDCEKLSAIYATGIDVPDATLFASAFAENAVWSTGAGVRRGRKDIEAYVAQRPVSHGKHSITNIIITMIDADHAKGTAYLIDYHWDTARPENIASLAPDLIGKFTDEYVRENGKWVFSSRVLDKVNTKKP